MNATGIIRPSSRDMKILAFIAGGFSAYLSLYFLGLLHGLIFQIGLGRLSNTMLGLPLEMAVTLLATIGVGWVVAQRPLLDWAVIGVVCLRVVPTVLGAGILFAQQVTSSDLQETPFDLLESRFLDVALFMLLNIAGLPLGAWLRNRRLT